METTRQQQAQLAQQVRRARGKFVAMAVAYAMGAFNDNFYKQAAMLLAVSAGLEYIQGYATVIFTLPFIVFAAHAGYLADRFSKRNIIIAAKLLEVAAAVFGAVGIIWFDWSLVLTMVGMMGLQAAIFSPAINGSIPELYPASHVTAANSYLKMVTTAAILVGVASAGFALGLTGDAGSPVLVCGVPAGRAAVAAVCVLIAGVGLVSSFWVVRRPAADPRARFPWSGPLQTIIKLWNIRRDRLLTTTIVADTFVWFAGALQVLLINVLCKRQFGMSDSATSGMVVAELVGIAAGGLVAGKIASDERWYRVLLPGAAVLAAAMAAVAVVSQAMEPQWAVPVAGVLLGLAGIAGGIMLIPLESFIQVRPAAHEKGAVIAAGNFAAFSGILLSGPTANLLAWAMLPSQAFGVLAGLTGMLAVYLFFRLRAATNAQPNP